MKNKHLHIWSDPGYATDHVFNGCDSSQQTTRQYSTHSTQSEENSAGSGSGSSYNITQPTALSTSKPGQTYFRNAPNLEKSN